MGHWPHGFGMLFWWVGIAAGFVVIFWLFAHFARAPGRDGSAEALLRRSFVTGERAIDGVVFNVASGRAVRAAGICWVGEALALNRVR